MAGACRVLVGVISDIHANLVALEAVVEAMGSVDAIWVTGDSVGYGPRPNECVRLLQSLPTLLIAGNHEWATTGKLSTEAFNPLAAAAAVWTAATLEPGIAEFLRGLPERVDQDDMTLVHGSPRDPIWEYVLDTGVAETSFRYFSTRLCLFGHTHVPSYFRLGGRRLPGLRRVDGERVEDGRALDLSDPSVRWMLNAGSVGQPRDDDPRASYMLLDLGGLTAVWHRVEYDIATTQRQMREAGLPARLIERLEAGW
ncbi:MAG: metallophosphoesterase family protein [Chloroflexi bacterium]|nr:metallophosphoesterase family protein [Chloroflexota bacterium]